MNLFSVIKFKDMGILPLLLSLPFMFYPKILDGDTQPWILLAAVFAFFTFRTNNFIEKQDRAILVLIILCILAYGFRNATSYCYTRHVYTYISFFIFWVVCQREKGDYFSIAIKATVIIWFLVGLYQYVQIKLGVEITPSGRYLAGRMGPPSLTAEASYYGSISMIHLMFLLTEKNHKNTIFIICAVASILLSGSLLAMILLIFPLMRLPAKFKIMIGLVLPFLILVDYYATETGVISRIVSIFENGFDIAGVLQDASLNLRAGHIYFTLFENLIPSTFLLNDINFLEQYNNFAFLSGVFIETGSSYILPAIGEMVYGAGLFAILLLVIIYNRAQQTCSTKVDKLEKMAFIFACMLNPITISNIFLVIYITRRGPVNR